MYKLLRQHVAEHPHSTLSPRKEAGRQLAESESLGTLMDGQQQALLQDFFRIIFEKVQLVEARMRGWQAGLGAICLVYLELLRARDSLTTNIRVRQKPSPQ